VPLWDSADIENWLVRFVGHDLRYDPQYVQADGEQVLFLLVDPPQQGDPIYCLQAQSSDPDGKTLREGSIYVRRNGLTEPASAADIARLGRRAGATTTELDLCVDLDASETCAIEAGWLWDETRDSYIEKEHRRLYSGLPNPREQQIGMLTTDFMEKRTRSEFQAEVEAYAAALRDNWFAVHATHHVEAEESELVPILVNDTSSNFEDVVLELTLPLKDIYVYLEPEDARAELEPPESPEGWAQLSALVARSVLPAMPSLPTTEPQPALEVLDDDRTLIRFPAMHVRPRTRHRLHRLLLALPPEFAGTAVELSWRVTSRSADGDLLGTTELVIADGPLAAAKRPTQTEIRDGTRRGCQVGSMGVACAVAFDLRSAPLD
jgi:hypothetical protein